MKKWVECVKSSMNNPIEPKRAPSRPGLRVAAAAVMAAQSMAREAAESKFLVGIVHTVQTILRFSHSYIGAFDT